MSDTNLDMPDGIFVLPNDHVSYTDSAKHIFSQIAKDKQMFTYSNLVMELDDDQLVMMTPNKLRSRLDRYGRKVQHYVVLNKDLVLKQKRCSRDIATALMHTREIIEELHNVKIVSKSPIITQRGILRKGLHDNGVLVLNGNVANIPLKEAVPTLLNLFRDFNFQTPSDKSRALAMMLTPAMKVGELISEPTPADLAEANYSQSGKTYRQLITRLIYGENGYLITNKNGGVGSLDESIGTGLLSGSLFIALENMRGIFNSQYLEAILTWRDKVTVRVPGRLEVTVDADMVSFQMTSNGIETTRDMANRSCIVRILKRPDDYQWHNWNEQSLEHHVIKNRPYYLGCVYAVIQAWIDKGMPRTNTTEHDMRTWAQSLDWIVQNVMGQAPLLDGHRNLQKRVSERHMVWLRNICIATSKAEQIGVMMQAGDIAELCEEESIALPTGKITTAKDAAIIGRGMSKVFKDNKSDAIEIDHFTVTRTEKSEYIKSQRKNMDIKRYAITN